VVCYDIGPLKTETGEPREVWKLDTIEQLKVFPHRAQCRPGFAASVAGYKDKLYVVTHNGVDGSHVRVANPDAPSLICLEKTTGKVLWSDNSPGKDILEFQLSSPLVVEVNGKPQVIVGQGDGWLRAFDALTGKLIWKCDLNPKSASWDPGGTGNRNYVVATPIYFEGRIYVATGLQIEAFTGPGNLLCIDPKKTGDVSPELDDGPKKGKPNPNSAVVWQTPREVPADAPRIEDGKRKPDLLRSREYYFGRSVAGCVAHDGLVYAADLDYLFCFDAKTGRLYWADDVKAEISGQLLWADGKVLVATNGGDLHMYVHGKERKKLALKELDAEIHAGPVFANGTLYLTTQNRLYAIRKPK
jgi:outer membrane protein assembly factor BamB